MTLGAVDKAAEGTFDFPAKASDEKSTSAAIDNNSERNMGHLDFTSGLARW
jgi:hypothetical protein